MVKKASPKRHPEYYFDNGNVIFLVEGTLFRVHRHFLTRESPVFRDMLAPLAQKRAGAEGLSDDKPILLKDVKSADFSRFLWLFYNCEYEDFNIDLEGWCSILHFAHQWQCEKIYALAVVRFGECDCDPVLKIEMCARFDVDPQQTKEAIDALVRRPAPLTPDEATRIGFATTTDISKQRERALRRNLSAAQSASDVMPDVLLEAKLSLTTTKQSVSSHNLTLQAEERNLATVEAELAALDTQLNATKAEIAKLKAGPPKTPADPSKVEESSPNSAEPSKQKKSKRAA